MHLLCRLLQLHLLKLNHHSIGFLPGGFFALLGVDRFERLGHLQHNREHIAVKMDGTALVLGVREHFPHRFDDTPEAITAWICSHLGVPFGSAASTGIKVYLPWLGKNAYEAIMAAYTTASHQNGKKYIPLMQNVDQVCVIEKGAPCGVVLDGSYDLVEATYKTSLQKLVDRVIITDKSGNQTSVVEDAGAQARYGVVQRVYKQEDEKDAIAEAKALLYTIEQAGTVTATSDTRAVSGYAIAVQEATTGLYGKFYIESDNHVFEDGKETMQLTLAFSNMMDEKEIGN